MIAATFFAMADALAPDGRNFLAILFRVSPVSTVYFLATGLGLGVGDGVALGVGFGVAVGVGVGRGVGVALGLGVAEGDGVGFNTGRFIGAEADFFIGLPVVRNAAKAALTFRAAGPLPRSF